MTTNNDCNLIPSAGVLRAFTSIADWIAITGVECGLEPVNSWPECATLLTHPQRPHYLIEMRVILLVSLRPFKNRPLCINLSTNLEDLIFENFGLIAQDES